MDLSCSKCDFSSNLQTCIRHFIMKHVDPSDVPFYCTLCGFRATNVKLFNQHLKKSKVHLKLVKDGEDEKCFLQKGKHYNVTWGKADSDLIEQNEKDVIVQEEKEDEDIVDQSMEAELELDDPKDISVFKELNDCGIQTEKDDSEIKIERLEKENRNLGTYIEKLEDKIDRLSKELRESKDEIRRIERYVPDLAGDYGFEEMWREHEEERRRQRVKSAVVVVGNKRRRVSY